MTSKKGLICSSLIYPWKENKHFFELVVYNTNKNMALAVQDFNQEELYEDCFACVISFKKPKDYLLGRIFYDYKSIQDLSIIAHESIHAGMQYCRIAKRISNFNKVPNEELLAYSAQSIYQLTVEISDELVALKKLKKSKK